MKRLLPLFLLPMALCAQTPAPSGDAGTLPEVNAGDYSVLPFTKFARDLKPVLNEDGTPKTAWYRAEVAFLQTPDAPPQGAAVVSVPQIDRAVLDGLNVHRFSPLLGQRYVYTDFIWVDRNPLGKLLETPIPFGCVFYFVVEREKDNFADIQIYCYATENLRWEDATTLGVDKQGDLAHNENFVPRPDLIRLSERVSVKLGNWTLFHIGARTEKQAAVGGIRQEKTTHAYVALRLRPSLILRKAEAQ